jgi:hypothetical protein
MSRIQTMMLVTGVAVAVIVIAVVVIVKAAQGSGGSSSPADAGLKRTADRLLPNLNKAYGRLPITDASLTSFQAWVYNSETLLTSLEGARHNAQLQLQFTDPSTLPPQSPLFSPPGSATVAVPAGVVSHVTQTHQPAYATVHQASGPDLRVYVVPLRTPALLAPAQCTGVLEIIRPET